ncbi:MAG: hypothetical protein IPM23_01590 [Candidatus Melainabacteria bacterium]|nr:hypothetical protein [Candidatus Melainabacteria bacterium]
MANFESTDHTAKAEPCSQLNSLEVQSQAGTRSEMSTAWSNKAKQLGSTELYIDQQGSYTVEFGDSLSGIARRSLKTQGVDSPSTRDIKAEQARIIDLNSDRYPHLAKNPGYIWENMNLRVTPNQTSDPVQNHESAPEKSYATPEQFQTDLDIPDLEGYIEKNDRNSSRDHADSSHADAGDRAEKDEEDDFKGIDLGILKLGYKPGDHAVAFGLDIGILDFDAQLGRESAVDIEAGLGDLAGVKGGVGIGVDGDGLHTSANGHGHALKKNIAAGGDVAANIGPESGIGANGHANVGPVGGAAGGDLSVDKTGVNGGYDASAGVKEVLDGHTTGALSLSKDSSVGASAGIGVFDNSLDLGAGVGSNRNTSIRPVVELRGSSGQDSLRGNVHGQIGPELDLSIGTGYKQLEGSKVVEGENIDAGIGMSGIGVELESIEDGRRFLSKHGAGKFSSRSRQRSR